MRIIKLLLFICFTSLSFLGWGQVNVPDATPITQNFDGMAATTTLPSNWKMHASTASPTWSGASSSVTQQASSGTPTAGGTYNWGETTTERAVGAMTSGGFASPNNLMVFLRNTNSNNLTSLTVSYTGERYRRNTAAASVEFYYSLNGTSWTAVTAGDIAAASFPTGTNLYTFTGGTKVTVSNFSVPGLNIATNSDIYLRWNVNTTGGNSQGIGIDDISITATFASSGTNTIAAGSGTEPASISSLINTAGAASLNFDIDIKDDGATPATDALDTKITQMVFATGTGNDVMDWTKVIAGAELTDGTNTQSGTINATNITFPGINPATLGLIADDATKNYILKVWLKTDFGSEKTTADGKNLEFRI